MPRELHPDLLACLERANPNVRIMVEMSAPDTERVLRRASDQFFTSPPLVSIEPDLSLSASVAGSLQLAATATTIADQETETGSKELKPFEDAAKFLTTFRWEPSNNFGESVLRSFSGKFYAVGATTPFGDPDDMAGTRMELQIYRAVATPLWRETVDHGIVKPQKVFTQWTFAPLLTTPSVVRPEQITWGEDGLATVTWNFQNEGIKLNSRGFRLPTVYPASKHANGEKAAYYFVVRHNINAEDWVHWRTDTGAETVEDVGVFRNVLWQRTTGRDDQEWEEVEQNSCPVFDLKVERYDPDGGEAVAIYELDLGREPSASAFGRVVFESSNPAGSVVNCELSVDGEDGPWVAVTHDVLLEDVQQVYHMRLTFTPNENNTASPLVHAFGIQYREPFDVSPEVVATPLSQDANVPFLQSSIGEGRIRLLRTGRRDYLDRATWFGANVSPPKIEADIYLGSDHPNVGRDKWFLLDRAAVSNRVPFETAEEFTLISIAHRLKRKIPAATESINSVHRVTAWAALTATVSPQLAGVTPTGNEYDGANYIMRVRSSANPALNGWQAVISGNTGIDVIQFVKGTMPHALTPASGEYAGDIIEIHSAIMRVDPIEWVDEDPALIWMEILTEHVGIPESRIGQAQAGRAGRGGLPPLITDIDPVNFDLRRVTIKIDEETAADELIDQLSFIMGGVTVVIAGQICFVQVYPMADLDGNVTVRPQATTKIFDPRDVFNLNIPPGLEQRSTFVQSTYGVDLTARKAGPARITSWIDTDANEWLTQQDLEVVGASRVPEEIARWFFNTFDQGRFLASEAARQVVQAASTGLRVATWNTIDMHPELQIGDTVVLSTDIYTDFDPRLRKPLFGWKAIRCVLVGVSSDRRSFRGYVMGLREVFDDIGGRIGSRVLKRPKPPTIQQIVFNSFGDMKVFALATDEHTATMRLGWSYVSQEAANEMAELTGIAPEVTEDKSGRYPFIAEGPFDEDVIIYVSVMPFALIEATAPGDPAEAETVRTSTVIMPEVEEIFGPETDNHASLYLKVVQDPQERVLSVDYQTRVGTDPVSDWIEAELVAIPGGLGATGNAYQCEVDLVEKHISTIHYRVHGYNADNDEAVLVRSIVPFQAGRTPGIPIIQPAINSDGTLDVIVIGDSDARSNLVAISDVGFDEAKLEDGTRLDGRVSSFIDEWPGDPLTAGTVLYIVAQSFSLTIAQESGGGTPLISEWAEHRLIVPALLERGQAVIEMTEETAEDITLTVDGDPDDDDTEVELVSVEGSTTKLEGANVGVVVPGDSEWKFSRAPMSAAGVSPGPGRVRFRVHVPGYRPDEDTMEIPEQGRDTTSLKVRIDRVEYTTGGALCALQVRVIDPIPQPGINVDIIPNAVGVTIDPATPGSISAALITNDFDTTGFGTYIVYPNPASTRISGRVSFTALRDNRVADSDSFDLGPDIERNPPVITQTVDAAGRVRATVVGDSAVLSYKWLSSNISMPSAGDVIASGSTVNGNPITLSSVLDLAIGETCYLAVLPYYFTAAAGTPGVLVTSEIDRVDTVASPVVILSVDELGDVYANISGLNSTQSAKYLASDSALPTDSAVRGETAVNGTSFSVGPIINIDRLETVYVKAFLYTLEDGDGEESPAGIAELTRPPDTIAAPMLVLADPNDGGDVAIAISGNDNTQSLKFLAADDGYPSLSTVRAQAAVNASHYEDLIDSNLGFGDELFCTALAYTEEDGGGEESPPARARVMRQNKLTPAKPRRLGAASFTGQNSNHRIHADGTYFDSSGGAGTTAIAIASESFGPGCKITGIAMRSFVEASGAPGDASQAGVILRRLNGSGGYTNIAILTRDGNGTGSWDTTSDLALDEDTDGFTYAIVCTAGIGVSGGATTKIAEVVIYYDAPTLVASI